MHEVTRILCAIEQGDPQAAEQLLPLVYDELRRLADVEKAQHWDSRGHFFAPAAEAMRRILIEQARRKSTLKSGGDVQRVDISTVDPMVEGPNLDLLALDEALERLAAKAPRKAELVKLRFFAGLTNQQAAQALGIAPSTADKDWAYAKCWLRLEMTGGSPGDYCI